MKRILIIGSGGAGKSTLAIKLAKKLSLPLVHLDCLFWKSGWVQNDKAELILASMVFSVVTLSIERKPGPT